MGAEPRKIISGWRQQACIVTCYQNFKKFKETAIVKALRLLILVSSTPIRIPSGFLVVEEDWQLTSKDTELNRREDECRPRFNIWVFDRLSRIPDDEDWENVL
jgi:hypothetical protein